MEQGKTGDTASAGLIAEFQKLIEQCKLPGVDMNAVLEARRKDLEAWMAANRSALEGMQALGQKQAETLRNTAEQLQTIVKQLASTGSATAASTGETMQQALHKTFANMQELAEAARKSQSDAFSIISRRVHENMDELRNLLQPKK